MRTIHAIAQPEKWDAVELKTREKTLSGNKGNRALFLFPTDRMGGAEQLTRMIARESALGKEFDHIDCFVLSRSRTGTLDHLSALPNVTLHYTGARNERRGLIALLRILARHRYDFVFSSHTHLNAFCSMLRWLGMLRTRRLVTRESTLIFERDFGGVGVLIRALYHFYGTQDMIVCQTERMRQSLNKHTNGRFSAKSLVISNPIDLDRINIAKREPTNILDHIPAVATKIVWCGRLVSIKAPIRALQTLRALHHLGVPNTHLVMIGDGPLADVVSDSVHKLGLDGHVTLCGYQSNPVAIMAHCDLGLLTSDTEGFPNVILEMLAAGVPGVVTTNCAGDMKDIPGVWIANVPSPTALADTIVRVRELLRPSALPDFLESRSPRHYFGQIGLQRCRQ